MDLKRLREPFPPKDVEFRAQTVTRDGERALALPYIDSRAVQDRLDEIVGPEHWQCRYQFSPDGRKTLCEIGILIPGGEWIWKADGAGDSDVEPEKGALSDAFKRAAVKWGIGRYLYDLPALWVPCESRDFNGKRQFVKFTTDPRALLSQATGERERAQPESRGDDRETLIAGVSRQFKELHPGEKFREFACRVLRREVTGLGDVELADLRALDRHLRTEAAAREGQARVRGELRGEEAPEPPAMRQGA